MRVLFFIAHPAHYHLFKHVIKRLDQSGHEIIVITKTKDVLERLLNEDKISFTNILKKEKKNNKKYNLLFQSIYGLIIRDLKLMKIAFLKKPSIMIGTDWSIAHVGRILGIPSILVNEDDTKATPENKYFYPFATTLLLPECCDPGMWKNKRVSFNSYHELAYLHPSIFIPSKDIILKFNPDFSPYVLIRLVSLTASHDINKKGINNVLLTKIVERLSRKFKVFICSEKALDDNFKQYQLNLNPVDIHHALFFASVFIGDSQTMAAEAGVLGTLFIRYNDFVGKIGYLEELENKYHLGFGYSTSKVSKLLERIDEITNNEYDLDLNGRRQKMLSEKINYADFMVWFLENYPSSVKIMQDNPEYQYNFR